MRGYEVPDGKASIPLNCSVQGDVTVILYHARSTFGGKVQGKITSIKICQFQFHSGFIRPETRSFMLNRHNLDQLDMIEKYPEGFRVTLDYVVTQKEVKISSVSSPWEGFTLKGISPKILFVEREEQHLVMTEFGVSERARKKLNQADDTSDVSQDSTPTESPAHISEDLDVNNKVAPPSRPAAPPPKKDTGAHGGQSSNSSDSKTINVGKSSFFDTLDWQETSGEQQNLGDGEKLSGQWQEHRTNLLEDISGDESSDEEDSREMFGASNQKPASSTLVDNFADFSNFRASSETSKSPPDIIQSSQAPKDTADILGDLSGNVGQNTEQNQQEPVIDLLNIGGGGGGGETEGVSLLDIGGPEPSNFDLLSSATGMGGDSETSNPSQGLNNSNHSSNIDLFGGFESFSGSNNTAQHNSQNSAVNGSKQNTFDPLMSVNQPQGQTTSNGFDGLTFLQAEVAKPTKPLEQQQSTANQNTKSASSNAGDFLSFLEDPSKQPGPASDDLMGTWSTSNIPRNSSFSNASRNSSAGSGLGNLGSAGFATSGSGSGSSSNLQAQQQTKPDPFAGLGKDTLPVPFY